MKKFYEFKNITSNSADLFIYGEIVLEKETDFWTGQKSETEIGLMDFKEQLDNIGNVNELNLYINSPGGDVFVASTMISMLQRLKDRGTTVNVYVDGLSASAASFLMFVADNIYLYSNSIVMIHKPMSAAYGNSNDFQNIINTLEKIEDSVMMPMYMKKAKIDENKIKDLIAAESWLGSDEMEKYFDVNILSENKQIAACIDKKIFKNYKNVPKNLILKDETNNIDNTINDKALEIKNKEKEVARAKLKLLQAITK